MTRFFRFAWCLPSLLVLTAGLQSVRAQQDIGVLVALEQQPGIVTMEMIADEMPIPEFHASTLVEVEGGLDSSGHPFSGAAAAGDSAEPPAGAAALVEQPDLVPQPGEPLAAAHPGHTGTDDRDPHRAARVRHRP